MATSNQDTNIKDVAAPASATTTNIGHVLGLNAAKTQDVLIPLSMLRTVIAAELKTALAAITSGSPDVPVLDGNNLKYMTLANFAKVVGEQNTPKQHLVKTSSTVKYYRVATATNNRAFKISITGCTTGRTSGIDINVLLSDQTCVAKASSINGNGYTTTPTTSKATLFYDSGILYLETSTYMTLFLTAYGVDLEMVEIESIPSTATAVSLS